MDIVEECRYGERVESTWMFVFVFEARWLYAKIHDVIKLREACCSRVEQVLHWLKVLIRLKSINGKSRGCLLQHNGCHNRGRLTTSKTDAIIRLSVR